MFDAPASGLQRKIVKHAGALLSEEGWEERTVMLEPPLGGGSGEPNIQPSGEACGEAEGAGTQRPLVTSIAA
jgi:hypothetical protein